MKKKIIRNPSAPVQSVEDALRELKEGMKKRGQEYRARSLALHGNLCARCGKEFPPSEIHLLTVHHKDSNSQNNPSDGSNWENLCAYCHEAEHSRELLGDYVGGGGAGMQTAPQKSAPPLGSFADLLGKAKQKKV